jgi:hypothetical protein
MGVVPQLCCSLEMNKNKKAWHAEKKQKPKIEMIMRMMKQNRLQQLDVF